MNFWRTPEQKARDAELARLYPLTWESASSAGRVAMRNMHNYTLLMGETRHRERQAEAVHAAKLRAVQIDLLRLMTNGKYSDRQIARVVDKATIKDRKKEQGRSND